MTRRQLRRLSHDDRHFTLLWAWRNAPRGQKAKRKQAVDDYIEERLARGL